MAESRARAFVAVEITGEAVLESIRELQREAGIDARPVSPSKLHFTLQFLGAVPRDSIPGVAGMLRGVKFREFDVSLEGVGAFPRTRSPRVVWVGVGRDGSDALSGLADAARAALEPLGFLPDKPFGAHVTVFRVKRRIGSIESMIDRYRGVRFGVQRVKSVKLKESVLDAGGAKYLNLAEVCATP